MAAGKPTALTPRRAPGVRAQCVALAAVAALVLAASAGAFLILKPEAARVALACAVLVSAGALILLNRALRPLDVLAAMLEHHAGQDRSATGRACERMLRNFTTIAARTEALRQRPRKHALTGLPTREALAAEIIKDAEARQCGGLGLVRFANCDLLLDTDSAERALMKFAQRLADAAGPHRPLGHIDRNCFALWFAEANAESAAAQLEAITYALSREIAIGKERISPDVESALACYPRDAADIAELINAASAALDVGAEGGAKTIARPQPGGTRRGAALTQRLRHAVRRGEFCLHYQPFVDLAVGDVVGAEALLRWPGAPEVSPAEMIAVAEESDLISEIGLWTFNTSCRQMREWRARGLTGVRMAVNVSTQQFRDRALPRVLAQTLAAHGLAPEHFELELTETSAMDDSQRAHASLYELREMGFSLSIDDFGSGYSSLAYLRRLPFQKLKIDREFVSDIDKRADSRAICKALIDLTAGLELAVLAEGVERFEEVEILRALGCPTFQGFYFARPMPSEQFLATVTDSEWRARLCSRVHREQHELRRRLS